MTHAGIHENMSRLADRTALQQRLQEHVEREHRPAALAVMDIDNFKAVNDRYGHDAGTRVLHEVARVLAEVVQSADPENLATRLRGDEFAAFFPNQDTDLAFAVMEEVRRRIQESTFAGDAAEGGIRVTISAGVAASPRDATGVTDLWRKADDGLWRAKKGNRNRIGLPSDERMVLKSTYYAPGQLERLSALANQRRTTEASLLREALDDLLRKYTE